MIAIDYMKREAASYLPFLFLIMKVVSFSVEWLLHNMQRVLQ